MTESLESRAAQAGQPDRTECRISPEGERLSWVSFRGGLSSLSVAWLDAPGEARELALYAGSRAYPHQWLPTGEWLLYHERADGGLHLRSVNAATGRSLDLTPFADARARLVACSQRRPAEALVAVESRGQTDLILVDATSGEREILSSAGGYCEFFPDGELRPRLASRLLEDGSIEILLPEGGSWARDHLLGAEDIIGSLPFGCDAGGRTFYYSGGRGRPMTALFAHDLETGRDRLLAEDAEGDVDELLLDPHDGTPQAVSFRGESQRWLALDPLLEADLSFLKAQSWGAFHIEDRSLDGARWLLSSLSPSGSVVWRLYERAGRKLSLLFAQTDDPEGCEPARESLVSLIARDGKEILCHFCLPPQAKGPFPLILLSHRGIRKADLRDPDPLAQWLAGRGYATLSVGYRSGRALGTAVAEAYRDGWSGAYIGKQLEAVRWAVEKGIADPSRVAVMGDEFGGHSANLCLLLHPQTFACGVDLVDPLSFDAYLEKVHPILRPRIEAFTLRLQERHVATRRALVERTLRRLLPRPKRCLLLGQWADSLSGGSERMMERLQRDLASWRIVLTYVLQRGDGGRFGEGRGESAFYAVVEGFFAQHLGAAPGGKQGRAFP